MQAYKDGIRSNQLGWHLLVSALQLGRHITVNDLLRDFRLFFPFYTDCCNQTAVVY